MVDLNVILDVIQHREPHYGDSARVVDAVVRNWVEGIIASHSVTTLNALALQFADCEDAVVNALAENANCDHIVTWNVKDFSEPIVRMMCTGCWTSGRADTGAQV